ncbi:PAS domain-containing sensor histidine kinase [Roseateles chitinivorans]|uniref:PAS domain-containing sensor histidine kinase n=1 Tax=Roseateles chitinivorans TaxID=2917965 RepID=UPI003D677CD9
MTPHRTEHGAWDPADVELMRDLLTAQAGPYGIAFLNAQGCLSGWTEGAHTLTGFSADDIVGQDFSRLFIPEDVARGQHHHELNAARTLGVAEDERWHMRKDGSRFWASGLTLPMHDGGTFRGFAKLFRDATHLQLRVLRLENELQRLASERKDRDVFLATIAHELRNPLQPMRLASRLLSPPDDPTRQEQAVKILGRQLGLMERLVEDLLDMTRVSQAKMTVRYGRVELQRLVLDAIDTCRESAGAAGIELISVLPPVPVLVDADPGRLLQVVVNLLNNAIKFTPRQGQVAVVVNVDASHFVLKVQDTGCGIAPDLRPRIFDMFTQADGASTRRGDGLGIGLALVKEIVALHHGTVEVKSDGIGQGSEFLVRIPLHKPVSFDVSEHPVAAPP